MALATPQVEPNIDQATLYEKLGYESHSEGQREYSESTARFNVPCCGRRWGKSQEAGHRMTYKSFIPNSYNWIVGPTYKLGEKEFRVVYRDYEKLGVLRYCKKSNNVNQGNMRIETPWKSVIEVVSADKPDSLLGEGLSHVIMSEAAKHKRDTWEQYVEPALSDLRGTADFPSTPQGFNWFHALWVMGQQDTGNTYRSWHFPTWTNPIRYPLGFEDPEIQRIKKNVSDVYFRQEYGAEFTAITGSIYSEWNEKRHVITGYKFNPAWPNYRAFDYGYANPFVALDIQITPSDKVIVWREYQESFKSTQEHGEILAQRDLVDKQNFGYHVDGQWGDPRGADEAATLALHIGFVGNFDMPWKYGVEQIKRMLKTGQLLVSDQCPNLIRQLQNLHVKPSGRQTQEDVREMLNTGTTNIQHKVDDHGPDALRYFIGPMFWANMGMGLEDLEGNQYHGSESQDYFTTLTENAFTLTHDFQPVTLNGLKF